MSAMKLKPERLARLRALCLALPQASEKQAWGDPTWRVGDARKATRGRQPADKQSASKAARRKKAR